MILAALYLLWAYQRVFHGEPDDANRDFPEIKFREGAVLMVFIGLIVFTGIYPKPLLDRVDEHADFDPRRHYRLTLARTELTDVERNAATPARAGDVELDL